VRNENEPIENSSGNILVLYRTFATFALAHTESIKMRYT